MKVPIKLFDRLYIIAQTYGISQNQWAQTSGIAHSRISELLIISKSTRGIQKRNLAEFGRTCSINKMQNLYKGLEKLIGKFTLQKELLKWLEKENDSAIKISAYHLIITNMPVKKRDAVLNGLHDLLR